MTINFVLSILFILRTCPVISVPPLRDDTSSLMLISKYIRSRKASVCQRNKREERRVEEKRGGKRGGKEERGGEERLENRRGD